MNLLQLQASDPKFSAWVSASAGTGKTKILTDRVLRLLIEKVEFSKILCLTFTNAAAGEMKERISAVLSDWSCQKPCELKEKLNLTLGRECTEEELYIASNIYHKYLKSDEKINIQTIHSFCQKLLKKFPLESGVSPSFSIIDETKAFTILKQIRNEVLGRDELVEINNYLNVNFHEITINDIISEIIQNKTKFFGENNKYEDIKTEAQETIQSLSNLCQKNWQDLSEHPLVKNIVGINQNSGQIKKFFLTDSGQKRKKIVAAKIAKPGSSLYFDLEKIQEHVYLLDQEDRAKQLELHSKLLYILGQNILEEYELYKIQKGLLDYDDLIIYSKKLLKTSSARDWILYKLDGGINHLLVDEAQDTSSDQWYIIESLIEEFYSGDSREEGQNRTVFIVGDEKQSIFSFQGADVNSFSRINAMLKNKMQEGQKNFKNIQLEISYRSAQEILDGVDIVFNSLYDKMPELFNDKIKRLSANRNSHSGCIEVWPLCKNEEETQEFWPILNNINKKTPQIILAEKIALFIKEQIQSKRVLPSTNRVVAPDDFMVLFRKRDELTNEVINALKKENIEVAGLDRISLCDNLAIMDLVSVARFVLNPNDNLNLCSLLKSPIIGLSEKDLYNICRNVQGANSIWQTLNSDKKQVDACTKLQGFIDLYKISHIGNFFQYIADVMSYREVLNASCGLDSNDAIDELIYISSDFYKNNSTSIQEFIFWFNNHDASIKRDVSAKGKVRIMTSHAAKGLQSPIVVLCDTTTVPSQTERFLWNNKGDFLSAKNSNSVPEYFIDIKKQEQKKTLAEYLRLLYVGMTRAEDHLIVCGYQGTKSLPENCWYKLVRDSLITKSHVDDNESIVFGKRGENVEIISNKEYKIQVTEVIANNQRQKFLPKKSANVSSYKNPSPLSQKDPMSYGLIFHKILEDSLAVPDLKTMKNHPLIHTLTPKSQARILKSINAIINNQKFYALTQENFRTEISIGTEENNATKIGRIDLMIIKNSEIVIVDYKSDLVPPKSLNKISKNYINQLDFYASVVKKIYPTKNIVTMVLWLESGDLMQIS